MTYWKNFMDGTIIEKLEPLIKLQSNSSIIKNMEIIKEKPDFWFNFISVYFY